MLTHHDVTVANALEVFTNAKDIPLSCWGFKDVGLSKPEMKILVDTMRAAGKTTFLEVVNRTEAGCMEAATLAATLGFDVLSGTHYYPAVWDFIKTQNLQYWPFVGEHKGTPGMLHGRIEELVDEGAALARKGIPGFNLTAFRYVGDSKELAHRFVDNVPAPVCFAGSVNTVEQIQFVEEVGAWGFTMGGALFDSVFAPGGSFRDNLQAVYDIMRKI
jgi:hypothetical protein